MGTKKGEKASDTTLAINQARGHWCRVPIKDGEVYIPELAPKLLDKLYPDERDRFEKRMRKLVDIATNILNQSKDPKEVAWAVSQAEAELHLDRTDVIFGKV